MGNCPTELGGLAILRGSHRYGVRYRSTRTCALATGPRWCWEKMLEELRWITTDYSAGDVLRFPSMTVHVPLHIAE